MIKTILIIFSLLIAIALTSCEKIFFKSNSNNTPIENFNSLWNELDEGYVYFDFKGIDWDSIKIVYELQVNNSMTNDQLFNVLANMLETLRDGHTSIRQSILKNRSYDIMQGYQPNFNKEFIIENYLIPNDMDTTTWIRHCFLNKNIGYLYYSTFTNEITKEGMDEILAKYENTKGLIFDVRGNLGGDASNIRRIIEHFVSSATIVGYSQKKNGPKRTDLSEKRSITIEPDGIYYDKPIIVLCNRQSYSAANAFVAYTSTLPNVTIMGDITGGGGGLPVTNQLSNGWFFTYSSTIGSLPNGFVTEDGIQPDIKVFTDSTFELLGQDNIIEEALASF